MTETRHPDRSERSPIVAASICLVLTVLAAGGCGGNARDRSAPVIGLTELVGADVTARREAARVGTGGAAPNANGEADGSVGGSADRAGVVGGAPPDDLATHREAGRPRIGQSSPGAIADSGPDSGPGSEGGSGGGSANGGDAVRTPAGAPPQSRPAGARPAPGAAPQAGAPSARASQRRSDWIVDGLVGQINGRPIFAESFLEVLEDRIVQIVATRPRPAAREEIMLLVNARFDDWVNSELIIAEAESQLSPEQQMGVIAWLRDVQEGEILRRGGTRAAAESSLQEERGMGIEEFLEMRRDRAMAMDLLRRRVLPRVIVTSRDIEREYARRFAEFNPGPIISVGRIWLDTERDAESVALASKRFADGAGFKVVADELRLPESGMWRQFELGPAGIAGLDLAEEIRNRLDGLAVDRPTEAFVQGRRTVWMGILEIENRPTRTLYDPEVQILLRNELQARREAIERARYIQGLRQRWIAEDIDEMRFRLIDIALTRYWL